MSQAERVRVRRAVTLLVMTVVAPGSAQLVAGDKRVGRAALRAAALGVVFVLTMLGLALFARGTMITLMTRVWFLTALRFALIVYAVGWALLLIDAWRIASPLSLARRQRLFMTVMNGVVCFSVTGALLFASHFVAVQKDFIGTVFGGDTVSHAKQGRYNVLLLGGDAGPTRVGLRPDSLTVASIDAQTGRTVLFALPRNLDDVPFPRGTVMHRQFPQGFNCHEECFLNAVNTWATEHKDLFPPSVDNPGLTATRQAVEQITGLKINYTVLVDLEGFQQLVHALGGITITVQHPVPIGGPTMDHVTGWIKPGRQHLNGYQTLWFSRSRANSNDYARMARQKCVMNAMLHQLNPRTVLTRFGQIADAGKHVLSTTIPSSEVDTFIKLALKARKLPVTTVSFVPPVIDTGDANWAKIRRMVKTAIAQSEAKDAPHPAKADGGNQKKNGHRQRPEDSGSEQQPQPATYSANQSSNLSHAC